MCQRSIERHLRQCFVLAVLRFKLCSISKLAVLHTQRTPLLLLLQEALALGGKRPLPERLCSLRVVLMLEDMGPTTNTTTTSTANAGAGVGGATAVHNAGADQAHQVSSTIPHPLVDCSNRCFNVPTTHALFVKRDQRCTAFLLLCKRVSTLQSLCIHMRSPQRAGRRRWCQ
jgi:hypothetical protein